VHDVRKTAAGMQGGREGGTMLSSSTGRPPLGESTYSAVAKKKAPVNKIKRGEKVITTKTALQQPQQQQQTRVSSVSYVMK